MHIAYKKVYVTKNCQLLKRVFYVLFDSSNNLRSGLLDRPESERNFAREIPSGAIIDPELKVPHGREQRAREGLTPEELDLRSDKTGKVLKVYVPYDKKTRLYEQSGWGI